MGKTVGELQDAMTLAEYNGWVEFDKTNPLCDRKRIYGPAALVASAFGGKFEDALNFLQPTQTSTQRALKPVEVVRYPKE